jgi:DNA polymerase III alpha subunit (gram-positive type)
MELNISELNNINTMNPYETFQDNYYEQQNIENQNGENYWSKINKQEKKKKVTFNDILSNMNLVVNKNGALQFMNMKQDNYDIPQYEQQYNTESLEPSLKNSYIYNKYFKDYSDPNIKKHEPRVPKTIEEYRQMLLDNKIAIIKQKQRIEQIKSKKMIFTSFPGSIGNSKNIQASRNNLRFMNFT